MSLQSLAVCSVCGHENMCDVQRVEGRLMKICGDCLGKDVPKNEETQAEDATFQETMERNKKNRERMERERLSANKSVLRSYRIKH